MKKLILIFALTISAFGSRAQETSGVVNALKSGNASEVSDFFDKILDIKFPNQDEIKGIGKNQAGVALKSFFDNNSIKSFELSSQREMGGTMYVAGKLVNAGEGYKVTIMMKTKDGKPQIITVRIS